MDELIGRADLLKQRKLELAKTSGLDLSFITTYAGPVATSSSRRAQCVQTTKCPTNPRRLSYSDIHRYALNYNSVKSDTTWCIAYAASPWLITLLSSALPLYTDVIPIDKSVMCLPHFTESVQHHTMDVKSVAICDSHTSAPLSVTSTQHDIISVGLSLQGCAQQRTRVGRHRARRP